MSFSHPLLPQPRNRPTARHRYTRQTLLCRHVRETMKAVAVCASTLVLACQPSVTRIHDGTAVRGRPIAPKAYAAYLRGRLLEHDGDLKGAEAEYQTTLRYDSKASDAFVRLGAIRCKRNPESAASAFEQAESISPNTVALFQERSVCARKMRNFKLAVESALHALTLAPDDPQNSYLLIVAHARANQLASARVLAWSLVSRFPQDSYGWKLLSSLYETPQQKALLEEAAIRTSRVAETNGYSVLPQQTNGLTAAPPQESTQSNAPIHAPAALISALYAGDPKAVSNAARRLRLTSLRLAIRAFELGAYDIAYNEALRAVRVAPDNTDAYTLALVLSDLLGKTETLTELLRRDVPNVAQLNPIIERAREQMILRHLELSAP